MLLCDREIKELAEQGMITPFEPSPVREKDGDKVISYGLSSYGYDMRLGHEFKVLPDFSHLMPGFLNTIIDPKKPCPDDWTTLEFHEPFNLLPKQSILGVSLETWHIPDDVFTIVTGKSTYARVFVHVLMTPMEPAWRGQLVIEIVNMSPCLVTLYPGEGIAQAIFFRGERPMVTYAGKSGKYQDQTGVTLGRA